MNNTPAKTKQRPFAIRLDEESGVPVYRQIMDQITAGIAAGRLARGEQLPTVRQLAVDLAVNPNTVIRAYRELEIRGVLETEQGTGTFIAGEERAEDGEGRRRRLEQFAVETAARAGAAGLTVGEVIGELEKLKGGEGKTRR